MLTEVSRFMRVKYFRRSLQAAGASEALGQTNLSWKKIDKIPDEVLLKDLEGAEEYVKIIGLIMEYKQRHLRSWAEAEEAVIEAHDKQERKRLPAPSTLIQNNSIPFQDLAKLESTIADFNNSIETEATAPKKKSKKQEK